MSTAEERFQAMIAKRKKNKDIDKEEKIVIIEEKEIDKEKKMKKLFSIEDDVFNTLTEDKELIDYLKNKSLEMLKIQGNNVILLGKNLTEVFEELGRKGSPEGLYIKYLEFNGYKKDTALRLRKRYEIFSKCKSEELKQIVSILPIRSMEQLYREQDFILNELEKNNAEITYKKVLDIINKKDNIIEFKEVVEEKKYSYNPEKIDILYREINDKYDNLDKRKKEKIDKLLFEIEKLLK